MHEWEGLKEKQEKCVLFKVPVFIFVSCPCMERLERETKEANFVEPYKSLLFIVQAWKR